MVQFKRQMHLPSYPILNLAQIAKPPPFGVHCSVWNFVDGSIHHHCQRSFLFQDHLNCIIHLTWRVLPASHLFHNKFESRLHVAVDVHLFAIDFHISFLHHALLKLLGHLLKKGGFFVLLPSNNGKVTDMYRNHVFQVSYTLLCPVEASIECELNMHRYQFLEHRLIIL